MWPRTMVLVHNGQRSGSSGLSGFPLQTMHALLLSFIFKPQTFPRCSSRLVRISIAFRREVLKLYTLSTLYRD